MDILKQSLAPLSDEAWQEIKSAAKQILSSHLSARRFASISGPMGWDYAAVPTGRLDIPGGQDKKGVVYGIHKVQPLIEPRISFKLNIWELDNLARGARDADLDQLEEAAVKLAEFEEKTVYYGIKNASVTGLKDVNSSEKLQLPGSIEGLLSTVSEGITKMMDASVTGPWTLVVSPALWKQISSHFKGYPLKLQLEKLLGGPVIMGHFIEEAFLVPSAAEDINLVIGQDISIGYESHNEKEVRLFLTESFTLRVNDPASVIMIG
ncbi:MAG: bacteriocin [Marinilabiliales bacterium]|nr:MAG: bacteriocin [Marinilabiliales bacterium]